MPAAVSRLTRADKPEVLDLLTAAFRDYPVMRFVLRDAGHAYDLHLGTLVDFFAESRFTRGWPVLGLRVDGRFVAVALASDPENVPWPTDLQAHYDALPGTIGRAALARLERYAEASESLRPDGPFVFLGMIGVRPGSQGRGHGRALLEAVSAYSAAHTLSKGVCLDTEDPRNVEIYRHLGYQVVGEATLDGDLRTWCMFRPDVP